MKKLFLLVLLSGCTQMHVSTSIAARYVGLHEVADKNALQSMLVIFSREGSSWKGHVGFYVKDLGDTILVLGGNTSDEVGYGAYNKSNLLGFRRHEKSAK